MPFATYSAADFVAKSEREMKALAPAELIALVSKQGHEIVKQEHEIVNLRRQVAWFGVLLFLMQKVPVARPLFDKDFLGT